MYEDYSMCTPIRDHRSAGHILSKLVAYVLQQLGVKIWYWGYKMEYMEEYCCKYGAREIERSEFYDIWKSVKDVKLKSLNDLDLPPKLAIRVPTVSDSTVHHSD